jgi:hypothetical protein
MGSVTVNNGTQNGTIASNSSFDWENTSTTGSCEVTDVGDWCEQSSYTVPQAASATSPGKKSAITLNVTGDFGFTCPCCDDPMPRIHVGSR